MSRDLYSDALALRRGRTVGPTWHPDARTEADREPASPDVLWPEHTDDAAPRHPRARLVRRGR